ncbi:MAG: fused response regulator/phosphatase [Candidatus Competibacteraceae bacterium]|nr:fused response regulator/phosphatase [Candidatus Competibacteraceae bacterium]
MNASVDRIKVLVIDDEPVMQELICSHLQARHFLVQSADEGRRGVDAALKLRPDVVICDLKLPDIHGFKVIELLLQSMPDLPIIVISGVGQIDDAVTALKLGAVDYFSKPLANLGVLEHAIKQALEHAQLRQRNRDYRSKLEQANRRLEANLKQLREDEEAGRRLQFQLLPPETQTFGNIYCSRRLWTSLYLSGDFLDYFRIDDDHLGFYIADVAGHGVSPAFVTILLKSYMNRYLELFRQAKNRGVLNPAKIMSRMNHNVLQSHLGKHLTMFYGIIEFTSNRLHYCNAGHYPYPILYDGEQAEFIESRGKPVGMFEFAEYRNETITLPKNFALTLLSDGVFEILPQLEIKDKLAFLLSLFNRDRITINHLSRGLGVDSAGNTLPDDITLMLIKRGF